MVESHTPFPNREIDLSSTGQWTFVEHCLFGSTPPNIQGEQISTEELKRMILDATPWSEKVKDTLLRPVSVICGKEPEDVAADRQTIQVRGSNKVFGYTSFDVDEMSTQLTDLDEKGRSIPEWKIRVKGDYRTLQIAPDYRERFTFNFPQEGQDYGMLILHIPQEGGNTK